MLRHAFGPFVLDSVDRSKEPDLTVPRLPPPVRVSFRRDGDISGVVAAIRKHPRVTVNAGMSAGKSTRLPIALSQDMGILVVHTVPFGNAALYLQDYLSSLPGGDRFAFMDATDADLPQRGVVLMTNTYFMSRMFADKFGDAPNFLLYMDENHESDSATSVLREIATNYSCVKGVVFATSTGEPGMDLGTHMPGKRTIVKYSKTPTKLWSATDLDKPWSASNLNENTLIFLERPSTVSRLASEYREHGFLVYVLTSRTKYAVFSEAMAALRDVRGPVTIVIVDYAHRSSLTVLGIKNIIESGEVALASVVDNAPTLLYRDAYDFEVQQGCARGGRVEGDDIRIYVPDCRFQRKMCDLESLEGDAAALMYRMLGYRPPHKLFVFSEASGPVPVDLIGALQGDTPLQLYPPESREPWVLEGAKAVKDRTRQSVYRFEPGVGVKPRPVSCRTLPEQPLRRSPSPPLNMLHNVTEIEAESLTNITNARLESPILTPVRTLSTRSHDNLSVLSDEVNPPYAKPKRIAQRVLDARQVMEKAQTKSVVISQPETVGADQALQLADHVLEVQGQAGKVFDDLARSATQVKERARASAFTTVGEPSHNVRTLLERTDMRDRDFTIPDDKLGTYYYYHGMDKAPEFSELFMAGFDSIVDFCQATRTKRHTSVLPERDKLYAVKIVLDKYNTATARVHGIQRLVYEIHKRPKSDFQDLLDPGEFNRTLQWALSELTAAKGDVLLSRRLLPNFLSYPLDEMSDLNHLENAVMREVLDRFEYAVVAKDPDKMSAYYDRMNNHKVKVILSNRNR